MCPFVGRRAQTVLVATLVDCMRPEPRVFGSRNRAEVGGNSLGEVAACFAVTRALDPEGSDTPLGSRASVEICHSVLVRKYIPIPVYCRAGDSTNRLHS
jgi:hypothetical protein